MTAQENPTEIHGSRWPTGNAAQEPTEAVFHFSDLSERCWDLGSPNDCKGQLAPTMAVGRIRVPIWLNSRPYSRLLAAGSNVKSRAINLNFCRPAYAALLPTNRRMKVRQWILDIWVYTDMFGRLISGFYVFFAAEMFLEIGLLLGI